jgi:hypothetical protein
MFKVSIQKSNEITLLGNYATKEEAHQAISADIKQTGFKSYYLRTTTREDGKIWLDYGSHSRFYLIEQV